MKAKDKHKLRPRLAKASILRMLWGARWRCLCLLYHLYSWNRVVDKNTFAGLVGGTIRQKRWSRKTCVNNLCETNQRTWELSPCVGVIGTSTTTSTTNPYGWRWWWWYYMYNIRCSFVRSLVVGAKLIVELNILHTTTTMKTTKQSWYWKWNLFVNLQTFVGEKENNKRINQFPWKCQEHT